MWLEETASIYSACRFPSTPSLTNYCCVLLRLTETVLYSITENLLSGSPFLFRLLLTVSSIFQMTTCSPWLGFWAFTLWSHRSAESKKKTTKKQCDWVLIWDCQTSRDDKVHTWEQGTVFLCIFCCNQQHSAKTCIHQSGIPWSCHHCGELWCHVVTNLVKTHALQ